MDRVEVAIIGAGAAGLAAARRLRAGNVEVLVLEARDRIGGRAHTVQLEGQPLDLGCEWLHSGDKNPWTRLAEEKLGFEVERSEPPWCRPAPVGPLTVNEQNAVWKALADFDQRAAEMAKGGVDHAATCALEDGERWNPMLDAISTWYNGAELELVSLLDYAAYADDDVNWRVPGGYGALVETYGAGVPVRLNTPVTEIDRSGPVLRIVTTAGELHAEKVVIAVPTPVIGQERLKITPRAPELIDACEGVPLGLADKVFFAVDAPDAFPADVGLWGSADTRDTANYHLLPQQRPIIEVFLGGRFARGLEAEGPGAATAMALEELSGVFGSGVRRLLRPLAETAWDFDPWSLGAYSHALPGRAGDRAVLRRPIEDRIFIAGEACSADAFSTAHGAYQSGLAAAEAILRATGRLTPED